MRYDKKILHLAGVMWTIILILRADLQCQTNHSGDDTALDTVGVNKTISLLLDGAIRNLEAAGAKSSDLTSTGLVGFRRDNERTQFKITISAYSSADTISGAKPERYAKTILNTSVTNSGLGSISLEYQQRFAWLDGFKKYLVEKKKFEDERPDNQKYLDLLSKYSLKNLPFWEKYLGYRAYFEMNSTTWKDTGSKAVNANVISAGIMATFFYQFIQSQSFNINLTMGVGGSLRTIISDLGQDSQFREAVISTDKKTFFGPEFYAALKVNNAYAKLSVPFFSADNPIAGLTGGQAIFSIGVYVDIGLNQTNRVPIRQVGEGGIEEIF